MTYQATCVADIIKRVNNDLFIPGIQRPFVWELHQITRLFDSLMQRYPIGSFLFWRLHQHNRGDWEIYKFLEHFWQGDVHNTEASIRQDQDVTLVLDGQQRLTSLVIGLRGSYAIKKKYQRRENIDAWEAKVLFLDLVFVKTEVEDDEGNPLDDRYRFEFFPEDKRPTNKSGEHWFEVGLILAAEDETARDQMLASWVTNNLTVPTERKEIAKETFSRLWETIWRDESIAYFTEEGQSYDKVLDIFIRANDGGTKLSRGDLLMSVITLRWQRLNARDEAEELTKALNETLQPKRIINREYLLRAVLYLADQDFSIRVSNFTPANITRIEQNWECTKQTLIFTAQMLREQGLYAEDLSSTNVVMMLAYYVQRINRHNPGQEIYVSAQNIERIRRWVIVMMADGIFGLQTTSLLSSVRSTIRKETLGSEDFPVDEILQVFRSTGRFEGIHNQWIDKFVGLKDDQKYSSLLVSLLYPGYLPNLKRRPICLVHSRHVMPNELKLYGVPDSSAPVVQSLAGRLVFAVALTESEIQDYYNYPFEEWIKRQPDEFFAKHQLPEDRSLYTLLRLPQLAQERSVLLRAYFERLFDCSASGKEPVAQLAEAYAR